MNAPQPFRRGRTRFANAAFTSSAGFTLIEAVVVIAVIGIVVAMIAVFIAKPFDAYVDQVRRAGLSDRADTALRRVGREITLALPNSVRVDPSGLLIEFLPVRASGRYRAAPDASDPPTSDFLDFDSSTDNSFDVLSAAVPVAAGDQLVIYNLGMPGADAYAGDTVRAITSTAGPALSNLSYAIGASQFPYPSPSNRFQIINTPITYVCAGVAGGGGTLRRYTGYAIQSSQPTDPSAAPLSSLSGANNSLVANHVDSCSFAYGSGPSARNGIVTMRLSLADSGEKMTLVVQAHVDNSP